MNSMHDMGGMHGLGPIAPEVDEPLFHAPWEPRALALMLAVAAWGRWSLDGSRHAREKIPGSDYLRMSYYETWIEGLTALMLGAGLISPAELASGRPDPGAVKAAAPLSAELAVSGIAEGSRSDRPTDAAPTYGVGEAVRARNINPTGHTRLPRYARGHVGVISADRGAHVFPDASAHGLGEQPQRLYQVRFAARELWGEAARAGDEVILDLWESYLDPA